MEFVEVFEFDKGVVVNYIGIVQLGQVIVNVGEGFKVVLVVEEIKCCQEVYVC